MNSVTQEESPYKIYSAMSSAVSEWLLMFLLFFNSFIAFLATKFARYCKLQAPCLFCSRLDHILGSAKPGFYKNMICDAHKTEISSLAYCHVHRRLADVREMCDSCLLSFASKKKLNMDTYRSLVRKMEINLDDEESTTRLPDIVDIDRQTDNSCTEDTHMFNFSERSFDFIHKRHCSCCHKRFRLRSHAHRLLQTTSVGVEIAEPNGVALGLTGYDCPAPRDRSTKRKEIRNRRGLDRLSHVGYSELKITSEFETELPSSDDDDNDDNRNTLINDAKAHSMQSAVAIHATTDEFAHEKLIHPSLVEHENGVTIEKKVCEIEPSTSAALGTNGVLSHGLEELNWSEVKKLTPPQSTDSELGVVEIGDIPCVSSDTVMEVPKTLVTTETNLKPLHINNDPTAFTPTNVNLSDAYKLAIAGKGIEPTPSPRDPNRAQEDLRVLLFQLSSARGLELPSIDSAPSPRICRICEEAKPSDRFGPTGLQSIAKRFSIERNESGFPSLDESILNEIEGENTVDRLKKLIEFERKSLILLYKELEEERSASAIAANQAMAMITRLQEEKAAMNMEALQYQRMMEEQSEYDQEALQRTNDLLAQKEREIQELESEISAYRNRFTEELKGNGTGSKEEKISVQKVSVVGLEDEKIYISKCLKTLEKKLRLYSTKGLHGAKPDNGEDGKPDVILENGYRDLLESEQSGDDSSHRRDPFSTRNPQMKSKETSKSTLVENGKGISLLPKPDNGKKQLIANDGHKDIIATVSMVNQLKERLEVLVADKNFLEHTINTLRNGNEGLQFIQEIACHLQDLRKAMLRREQVAK